MPRFVARCRAAPLKPGRTEQYQSRRRDMHRYFDLPIEWMKNVLAHIPTAKVAFVSHLIGRRYGTGGNGLPVLFKQQTDLARYLRARKLARRLRMVDAVQCYASPANWLL